MACRRWHGLAGALSARAWLVVFLLGITHDAYAQQAGPAVELVIRGCDAAADGQGPWVDRISAELPGYTISPETSVADDDASGTENTRGRDARSAAPAPTTSATEAWQRTSTRPLFEITPIFGIAAGLDTEPQVIPGTMLGGYLALVGPHRHGGALRGGITLLGETEGGFVEPLYIYRRPLVGSARHGIALGLEAGPFAGLIRDWDVFWPDSTPNDLALALGAVMGSELIYRAYGFSAALGARLRWIQPIAYEHEGALLAAEASLRIGASFLL